MLKLDGKIDPLMFFSWWGRELSFLLPNKFRKAITRGKSLIVVEIKAETAKISYVNNELETHLGEFDINALAKEELQTLIESNPQYEDVHIVLRVPEQQTIKQVVFLPAAAEVNLHQVMSYELDRYTPFNKEQVYFDLIQLEQEKNNTQIQLVLILVKKKTLEHMYESCMTLGLKPSYADSAAQVVIPGNAKRRYNLLPKNLCQKTNKTPLFLLLGAIAITLALFITLLLLPLFETSDSLEKLRVQTRKVEKMAMQIEDSKKGIDFLYQATQQVIDKKNASPAMVEVLNKLSVVLTDDTWVSRLQYSNKILQLTGQSASASNLISSLEEMKIFNNVKFTSPVTKDKKSGLERFRLSTEVTQKLSDAE